jgi:hypothetical protein
VPLPLDVRLALSPLDTYRQSMSEPVRGTWLRAIERPALVAVIIGTAMAISSARRVPLGLVAMSIVCWSFVAIVQSLIGLAVIDNARGRPMSAARCLELLFVGQLPWSLWTLAVVGVFSFTPFTPGLALLASSMAIPAVWTTIIVFAFCRTVLGCSLARARVLTVAHQAMTWAVFATYVFLVSGIWARLLAAIGA